MFTFLMDIGRLLGTALVLARHDVLIPKELASLVPPYISWLGKLSRIGTKGRHLRPGQRLANALQEKGPAYVKLGQILATRPDIIGFDTADDLAKLQDRMPAFSRQEAVAEIESAFGKPLDQLFATFSEPVAAASIAQVHKAVLTTGQSVAVKVLRPDIERQVTRQFRTLLLGAKILEKLIPAIRRLEPIQLITTLAKAAEMELDLRLEAGAASELADNLKADTDIHVPQIMWDFSSRRVLTLEWIDGVPITDLPGLKRLDVNHEALAQRIMRSFLSQALNDGFFHADMHQGNLLIDQTGRLVLIDFGIMGRLDEVYRRQFGRIIFGFIQRDYKSVAQAHFDAGWIPSHYAVDAFATALRAVGEPIFGRDSDLVDMSRILRQLFDITEIYDMHMRPELILLQRTMVMVEGVARALYPRINMWETADPVVRDFVHTLVGPQAALDTVNRSTKAALRLAARFPEFVELAERGLIVAQKMDEATMARTMRTLAKAFESS